MPCFTNGTNICTLTGEMPIEDISIGTRVITRDNGLQTVRRIFSRDFDYGQLAIVKHLQPVLVRIGGLGKGLPERDLLTSPNLRLLVSDDTGSLGFGSREQLIAAKNLIDNHGIRTCSVLGLRYTHIEFDRHEVILANGVWAESFKVDDASLGARGNAQRTELMEIFPELRSQPSLDGGADRNLGRAVQK